MSEPLRLTDVWRRSLGATVQFYSAIAELAIDCVETLVTTITQSNPGIATDAKMPPASAENRATTSNPTPVSMMVLEAEVGRKALGIFLVENGFPRAVSGAPTASAFIDEEGNEFKPTVEFQPSSITLQPREQILVKVLASISEDMSAGVRYRGEIGVPGLMGTRIPVVLGRTAGANPGPQKARITSPPAPGKKSRRRTTSPNGKSKPPAKR